MPAKLLNNVTITTSTGTLTFVAPNVTLTVPATGTAALLERAQTFTQQQIFAYGGVGDPATIVIAPASGNGFANFKLATNNNYEFFTFQDAGANLTGYLGFIGASAGLTGRDGSVEVGSVGRPIDIRPNDILRYRFLTNGGIEMYEQTAPSAGAADTARLFVRDNGSGKTQVCVIFNTGAIQVIATQP